MSNEGMSATTTGTSMRRCAIPTIAAVRMGAARAGAVMRLIEQRSRALAVAVAAAAVVGITFGAAPAALAQSAAELEALENELMAVSERIERLEDLSEVEIVQRAYGYYVDKSLWYDLADLWTEDGTLEIGGRGVFLGRDRVFEYMNVGLGTVGPKRNLLVDHQQFQPIVTIHPDGKTAELRAIAFVMSNGGWGHNYYENDYVKEDGVWKMAKLHGPFNMYSGYDIGWLDNTTLNTFPEKFPPPPDLPPTVLYLTFPNYYVEPFHYPNPVTGEPMPPPDPAAGGAAFGRYQRPAVRP